MQGLLASLNGQHPMPVGNANAHGLLGPIMQRLLEYAGRNGMAQTQTQQPDPQAEMAMARLLGLLKDPSGFEGRR